MALNFVAPLMEDLEALCPGFQSKGIVERFHTLADINAPYIGKGECLPVICPNFELAWFQAFSGSAVNLDWGISDGKTGGILPLQFSEHSATQLTHGARFVLSADAFRKLPPAYRVAVIAEHILENTVTGYTEAFTFAMGRGTLKTYRASIAPKTSITQNMKDRRVEGWTIHIRDARPTNEQLLALGRIIRAYDDAVSDDSFDVPYVRDLTELQETDDHRKAKRSGSATTREMVDFVDDLIASGVDPRRGGNSSWREAWRQLLRDRRELSEKYPSPEAMMQSYAQYKKRHKDTNGECK